MDFDDSYNGTKYSLDVTRSTVSHKKQAERSNSKGSNESSSVAVIQEDWSSIEKGPDEMCDVAANVKERFI